MNDLPLNVMQDFASKDFSFNKISNDFIANFVYHSLSFETNSLTLDDVKKVINNEEHNLDERKALHIINYHRAFMFVLDLVRSRKELDENTLKDIHEILMNEVNVGGLYRNVDISVNGSNYTPPAHLKVYDRMKKYFQTLEDMNDDVIEKISYSLLQLDKIHPFLDGNGRLARIVLNYHLMINGFAPVIIPHEEKHRYFECTEEFKVNKNINPFKQFLLELIHKSNK